MAGPGPPGPPPEIPPRFGARWPDFTLRGFTFRQVSALGPRQRGRVREHLAENRAESLPPEIRCADRGELDRDVDDVRREAEFRGSGAAAAVQEFQQRNADRMTEAETLGDVFPIRFGVFEEGDEHERIVGAFEWYGIIEVRTLPGRPPERHLRAMPFPAFHRMFPALPGEMRLCADVVELFLEHPGLMVDGALNRFVRVRTFTFDDGVRNSRGDRECRQWNAEIDARGADPRGVLEVTVDTNAWGRERRAITLRS